MEEIRRLAQEALDIDRTFFDKNGKVVVEEHHPQGYQPYTKRKAIINLLKEIKKLASE